MVVTAFVIVNVTPDGTVAVTPLLIVKAQPVKLAAKGAPEEDAMIMFLLASGAPLLQEEPFHVVLRSVSYGNIGRVWRNTTTCSGHSKSIISNW